MNTMRINTMPAITWHFLKMNDATFEIPSELAGGTNVDVVGDYVEGDCANAFERALADAQERWEATHPTPTAEELAEREAYRAAEADATYGGTAQSAYQAGADAIEESRSLAAAFAYGLGEEAAAYLDEAAGKRIVVQAGQGETAEAEILVTAVPGELNVAAVDVVADRDSVATVTLAVDGAMPRAGESQGIAGTTLRVFAGEGARVTIVRTQTLDDGFIDIDNIGLFADSRALIDVRQTVLGASETYTGLAGDLRGDDAVANVETHYLGHGDQAHDFNYVLRHHGLRTRCNLNTNGVLAGSSRKTLRGTIDLIRGCKGSEGRENETVLLVDEKVQNKTIPIILCNEDDVAGNHGATIGHIRDEQLFYLTSRGLSQEAAEAMFVGSTLEQAAIDAPSTAARTGVLRLGEQIVPGFADLFIEEA